MGMAMHGITKYIFIVVSLVNTLCFAHYCVAEEFSDFAELNIENILATEIISASGVQEKLYSAPNAVYVVTAEDIKKSGAVDLPDLFRMVPGVDVVNIYGNSYGVSARGFNERFAQRMLVCIDGRSIYTEFFGGVFWENEEVFLEDIKRIEVIRGPGASIWGANSVNGVINIITKDPEEDQGFLVTTKVGTKDFREGVARYSGTVSDTFSVKMTGGYREDEGTRGVNDFRRVSKINGNLKYTLAPNSIVNVFAGANESDIGLDVTKYTTRTDAALRSNHQMLRWDVEFENGSDLKLQGFRSYHQINTDDKVFKYDEEKYDLGLQYSFYLKNSILIISGVNYRNTKVDSTYLASSGKHNYLKGFFTQGDITLGESLKLVAGLRYEKNSFTGWDWSPRVCMLYSPNDLNHFRVSVSRAYRTPSFVEDDFRVIQNLNIGNVSVPLGLVHGNTHLKPERMTAFEFGYKTFLFKKLSLDIELYYNEIDDVIENSIIRTTWPLIITWENDFNAIAKGLDIAVNLPVCSWWSMNANYSFQEVEYKRVNEDVAGTPKHKVNIGSYMCFKNGFSVNAVVHYVDNTKWSGMTGQSKADDYIRLDVKVSKKFINDSLELSLVGQNLTDTLHVETSDVSSEYEADRLIYGQITCYFK